MSMGEFLAVLCLFALCGFIVAYALSRAMGD